MRFQRARALSEIKPERFAALEPAPIAPAPPPPIRVTAG